MSTGKALLLSFVVCIVMVLTMPVGVGFIIWLGTSIWVGSDSAKIEFHKYKSAISTTPFALGFVTALLWLPVFPWYLIVKGNILSGKAELKDEFKAARA